MTSESGQVFHPKQKSIFKLFGDTDSFYQIPNYQRAYNWMDDQVKDLWDDILKAKDSNYERYFLGPIILVNKKGKNYYEVVDGQQRLTTLTILFCVVRDSFKKKFIENGFKRLMNRIEKTIYDATDETYRLKLITQKYMQNEFRNEVLKKVKFLGSDVPDNQKKKFKFRNTAQIFKEKLKTFEIANGIKNLAEFLEYILNSVEVITITCSKSEYAINLFEVLNTRGLELTHADLIKTFLIIKCVEDKKDQFVSDWNYIENKAKDLEKEMTDLLTYYQYYLIARNPKRSLYIELKKEFEEKDPNEVIYGFKKVVSYYEEIMNIDSKVFFSLLYLPNEVYWKAILISAKMVEFHDFNGLCKLLRKLYYSYWIAGYTITKIKQTSFNIIAWIKAGMNLNEVHRKIINKMKIDTVIKKMKDALELNVYKTSWIKPLLLLIEYNQTDDSTIVFIKKERKLHVEHIIPIEWRKENYWVVNWNEGDANEWLNRLGNLTLLAGDKNIIAKYKSFEDKKKIYAGEESGIRGVTSFLITQVLIKDDKWTIYEVLNRDKWLKEEIKKVLEITNQEWEESESKSLNIIESIDNENYSELYFPYQHINQILKRHSELTGKEVRLRCLEILKSKTILIIKQLDRTLKESNKKQVKEEMLEFIKNNDDDLKDISKLDQENEHQIILTRGRLRSIIREIFPDMQIGKEALNIFLQYLEDWLGIQILNALDEMKRNEAWRKTLLERDFF